MLAAANVSVLRSVGVRAACSRAAATPISPAAAAGVQGTAAGESVAGRKAAVVQPGVSSAALYVTLSKMPATSYGPPARIQPPLLPLAGRLVTKVALLPLPNVATARSSSALVPVTARPVRLPPNQPWPSAHPIALSPARSSGPTSQVSYSTRRSNVVKWPSSWSETGLPLIQHL